MKREAHSFPNTSCAVPVRRRKREAPEHRPEDAIVEQVGAPDGVVSFDLSCQTVVEGYFRRPCRCPSRNASAPATSVPAVTPSADCKDGDLNMWEKMQCQQQAKQP